MKRIFLGLLFFLSLFSIQGQQILVTHAVVEQSVVINLSNTMAEVELSGTITNNSASLLEIKWIQNLWDQPFEWQTEISDKDNYYFTNRNGYTESEYVMPLILKPGESFTLNVHVFPSGRAGTATYTFDIIDIHHPDEVLESITYYLNVQQPKKEVTSNIKKVSIFPVPAASYFEMTPNTLVYTIKISNSLGQEMTTLNVTNDTKYNISKLPDGLYFIALIGKNGQLLRTLSLFKQLPKA